MSNRSLDRVALLALALASAVGAQDPDHRVYPDPQPFKHYAWIVDTAALEGAPAKILRRPGRRPQDVILVARTATAEDLLLATQTLDLARAAHGDTVRQAVEITPRGTINRESRLVAHRLLGLENYLATLRTSSPQSTADFGDVRLLAMELKPPGHLKEKKSKP